MVDARISGEVRRVIHRRYHIHDYRFESCPDYDPFGRFNLKQLAIGRDTDAPNRRIDPASGPWQVFGSRADVTGDSLERQANTPS